MVLVMKMAGSRASARMGTVTQKSPFSSQKCRGKRKGERRKTHGHKNAGCCGVRNLESTFNPFQKNHDLASCIPQNLPSPEILTHTGTNPGDSGCQGLGNSQAPGSLFQSLSPSQTSWPAIPCQSLKTCITAEPRIGEPLPYRIPSSPNSVLMENVHHLIGSSFDPSG